MLPVPKFNKKYLHHQFVGDCVLLYDDQIWRYHGKDRYDKLSFRLAELREELDEIRKEQIGDNPEFNIRSITESEIPGKFLYLFEVCAKNDPIDATNLVVASDKEIISAVRFPLEFTIMPDSCKEFEVNITPINSVLIRIHNLNEEREVGLTEINTHEIHPDDSKTTVMTKSPYEQIKLGINPTDVKCNPGFELIMKNSDNSPACVFPATKIKLIDRGWAKPQ